VNRFFEIPDRWHRLARVLTFVFISAGAAIGRSARSEQAVLEYKNWK